MEKISLVIPCYNEEEAIPLHFAKVEEIISKDFDNRVAFELIYINDGSKDQTANVLFTLAKENKHVKVIDFSRNFGKESAMLAGLQHATGDYVTIMDVDLQDPPELLIEMFGKLQENDNLDIVATYRENRKGETRVKSFFSNQFYHVMNKISDVKMKPGARDYRMMRKNVVDSILSLTEYNRFSKGIFMWVGYETEWISFENVNREVGKTKFSFFKLISYAIDGIISFSIKPLILISTIGLIMFFFTLFLAAFVVLRTLFFGDPVNGWTSQVAIMLFIGSIQILGIGVLGQYMARIYSEVKGRPNYIIKRKSNFENENDTRDSK